MTTLLGRRRQIPELRARNRQQHALGERLAVNTVIQGTAADIIKVAMVRCDDAIADLRSRLILQIHDELLFEGPPEEPTRCARSSRARWPARGSSTRRSRSTSVSGRTGSTPSDGGPQRCDREGGGLRGVRGDAGAQRAARALGRDFRPATTTSSRAQARRRAHHRQRAAGRGRVAVLRRSGAGVISR